MNPRSLIRTMLVDDEPLARKNLQLLLARDESIDIVAQCENGNDALLTLQKEDLDLVYLDIQMPGMSGIELLRNLDIEKFLSSYSRQLSTSSRYTHSSYMRWTIC